MPFTIWTEIKILLEFQLITETSIVSIYSNFNYAFIPTSCKSYHSHSCTAGMNWDIENQHSEDFIKVTGGGMQLWECTWIESNMDYAWHTNTGRQEVNRVKLVHELKISDYEKAQEEGIDLLNVIKNNIVGEKLHKYTSN